MPCDKSSSSHQQGSTEMQWHMKGNPNNTLLQALPGPSAHHRPISTILEEHKAKRQVGTQIKDSEEGTSCLGPSQGCPRNPWRVYTCALCACVYWVYVLSLDSGWTYSMELWQTNLSQSYGYSAIEFAHISYT